MSPGVGSGVRRERPETGEPLETAAGVPSTGGGARTVRAVGVGTLLWAALVLVPVDLVAQLAGAGDVSLFVLSVLALIPLAWLIGEATEQVGEYTGPAVAGLLNASFGNAPELIISLFAVSEGLFTVVRGSLAGSVIGNLLLVLGSSLVAGGRGPVARRTAYSALGMTAVAVGLFGVATALTPRPAGEAGAGPSTVSIAVAAVLFTGYVVVTARSMRRETRVHGERAEPAHPGWSLRTALVTLGVATLATVGVSEILTGSIESFAAAAGLSDLFVAAVIVAIAGNAAEHGGAVVIAARGNVRLASEIGLQSAVQVATGLIPAVVLLSLLVAPMALTFGPAEFIGMGVATVVPALLLIRGRSTSWHGALLCAAYAVVVGVFLFLAG